MILLNRSVVARHIRGACCILSSIILSAGMAGAAVVGIATAPTNNDIESAVREAVAWAGGLPSTVGPGKRIVIQPNLTQAGWQSGTGVVTDSRVIRAIVKMCLEMGATPADIIICEGSASFYGSQGGYSDRQMTLKAFRDCGLDVDGNMVEDQYGVQLFDANNAGQVYPNYPNYSGDYDGRYVTRIIKGFLINRQYLLPNIIAQCDVLIRVPTLKSHNLAGVTGALKLSFGHAPSDIYHYPGLNMYKWSLLHLSFGGFDELTTNSMGMADMNYCRPPDFLVMDGLVGVTNGPCGGDGGGGTVNLPSGGPMRMIGASRDPVALDTVEALACGYKTDLASVPSLHYAPLHGLGTNNLSEIQVRGKRVKDIRRWFPPWGAADPGDRVAPVLGDISLTLDETGLLRAQQVGAFDASPGLAKAELYVDGVLVDSNAGAGFPTSCVLAGAEGGNHAVTYVIYDGMLNETSITRTVNVPNGPAISSALGRGDGTKMFVGPVVFTGRAPAIDANTFFVSNEQGTSGLRVKYWGLAPDLQPGQRMALHGTVGKVNGQRVLNCWAYSLIGQSSPVRHKFMANATVGGNSLNELTPGVLQGRGAFNLGCLVRTSGVVSAGGADFFYVDDGSMPGKLKVLSGGMDQPAAGSRVLVCGFSSCEDDGGVNRPVLVLRSNEDVTAF